MLSEKFSLLGKISLQYKPKSLDEGLYYKRIFLVNQIFSSKVYACQHTLWRILQIFSMSVYQNTILQLNHPRTLHINESNKIIFPQTSTFTSTKNIQNKENAIRKSKLLLQKEQFKAHHHTCMILKRRSWTNIPVPLSLNVDTNSTNFAPSTTLPQTITKSNKQQTIQLRTQTCHLY